MKVLIADFDLFAAMGGGQAFYRSVIERNPKIDFYYLSIAESSNARRPANAHPILYRERYRQEQFGGGDALSSKRLLEAFIKANNVACAVQGRSFDAVDVPEYERFGMFLRPALVRHRARCDRIALSLHGRLSMSAAFNWDAEEKLDAELADLEDLQFQAADLRYGLSRDYLDACRKRLDLQTHYFSPLRFLRLPEPVRSPAGDSSPSLQFIGRMEKCKGPDLFVEMAWWLRSESYGQALMVGPHVRDERGISSRRRLQDLVLRRRLQSRISLRPAADKTELRRLFASRALTVLPSRFDSLNLVALQSLFSGCPTAIGSGAGVCRFLEDSFPDVPFIKIDVDHWHASLPAIEETLARYDDYRDRLVEAVRSARPEIEGPDLATIYQSASTSVDSVSRDVDESYSRWMNRLNPSQAPARESWRAIGKRIVKGRTSPEIRQRLQELRPGVMATNAKAALSSHLGSSSWRGRLQAGLVLSRCPSLLEEYRRLGQLGERTERQLDAKAERCAELLRGLRADRIHIWRELARIESLKENSLIAATYRLRAMRLAGGDPYEDLPDVIAALNQHGYAREASTADALFGPYPNRDERQRRLLQSAEAAHRRCPEQPYQFVDDRRAGREVKASVVVSLYNAADKLPTFLRALALQTLLAAGKAELILIDSGSPDREYAVFREMAGALRFPVVYARSVERETIQSAWNRGIALSRGDYLAFLGVDEGVRPQALELLARELDADPALDWVQANSLATNVNERGQWLADALCYDRSGYRQSLVYLETCYLSWVGAMYRRSIHDRCGYYDPSFGAAGDTEFKCRVLPHIKTKVVPETLGVFWNYPSGQTTCSPRAELEDLRAWHLHRTVAGVRYAFERRPLAEVEELLYASLRYRKSYCRHMSTDVEYAYNLATFLKQQTNAPEADKLLRRINALLGAYRSLDFLPQASAQALGRSLGRAFYLAEKTARQRYGRGGECIRPACQVFNDNRYEQHVHVWANAA